MTTLRRLLVAVYPIRLFLLALAAWGVAVALDVRAQSPVTVGYYDMNTGAGAAEQVAPIVAAGFTPMLLNNVTPGDLADLHILFVQNSSPGMFYGAEYLAGRPAVQAAVNAGAVLIIHDRNVGGNPAIQTRAILPLPAGVVPLVSRSNSNDIGVSDPNTLVANGPGGIVTDANLDGAFYSNMGVVSLLSLMTGGAPIAGLKGLLHRPDLRIPDNFNSAVTFSYAFGQGFVIYSSIPLDMFLKGGGPTPPRCNFTNTYAPNILAYAADLKGLPRGLPQPTTLTVTASPAQYGGTTTLTASLKSGSTGLGCRTVSFSINGTEVGSAVTDPSGTATLLTASVASLSAGSHAEAIRADFAGDGLLTASSGTAVLVVTKAPLTVTAADKIKVYGEGLPDFSAQYDGFVLGEAPSVLEGVLTFATPATQSSAAGTYAITPYGLTSNNYDITFNDGTLTVDKASVRIEVAGGQFVYDRTPHAATGSVIGVFGELLGTPSFAYTDHDGVTSDAAPVNAGVYGIIASSAETDNYLAAEMNSSGATIVVTPAPLTVSADDKTKVYGAPLPTLTATFDGFVANEDVGVLAGKLSFSTEATVRSAVAEYAITASGLSSANYAITFVNGTLAVTPAPLKIRADDKERLVGILNPALTVSYQGFVLGESDNNLDKRPTVTTSASLTTPPGNYPIVVDGAADPNYAIEQVNGTLTLSPEGRISGSGYVDTPGARHHFVFESRETIILGEKGSLSLRVDRETETEADDVLVSQLVTSVIFKDNPDVDPGGKAIADSVTFRGIGTWNGAAATFEVLAADNGEGGVGEDIVTIHVAVDGVIVHTTSGTLNGGNVQSNRVTR